MGFSFLWGYFARISLGFQAEIAKALRKMVGAGRFELRGPVFHKLLNMCNMPTYQQVV